MRLFAAILVLVALLLLGGAAYFVGDTWKLALYVDVLAWALAATVTLCVIVEAMNEPKTAWVRAGIATAAGIEALAVSLGVRPGTLDQFPFRDPLHSAISVSALGFAVAALVLGAAAVKLDKRGPNLLAGAGMVLALAALRGWLQLRT